MAGQLLGSHSRLVLQPPGTKPHPQKQEDKALGQGRDRVSPSHCRVTLRSEPAHFLLKALSFEDVLDFFF